MVFFNRKNKVRTAPTSVYGQVAPEGSKPRPITTQVAQNQTQLKARTPFVNKR